MKTIWITWEEQRRNKPIARELDADFYQLSDTLKLSRILRYLVNIARTFNIYRKEKPDVVIVQNPSIILALFSVLMKSIFKFTLGVDTHNFGFGLPNDTDSKFMHKVAPWVQKKADFVIVHNDGLKEIVKSRGGKLFVLPDKIPYIKRPKEVKTLNGKFNFLFISSYAKDEPWEEVVSAFSSLPYEYHVYITGNFHKVRINPDDYPSNIHFLGRIPWDEYDQMLYSVHAVIDLTTRENCLLCGAYEAVACEKPLILTNTETLRSYFSKGAIYTTNKVDDILQAVMEITNNYIKLENDIKTFNREIKKNWGQRVGKLKLMINSLKHS